MARLGDPPADRDTRRMRFFDVQVCEWMEEEEEKGDEGGKGVSAFVSFLPRCFFYSTAPSS